MTELRASRSARRAGFLALAAGLAWAATAAATVVVGLERDALVRHADGIVAGEVSGIEFVPGPAEGPMVYTRVTIAVWQTYRALPGGPSDRVVLTQSGGTLGGKTLHIAGHADFAVGEPVLVFLERLEDGRVMPLGMAQGKFTLVEDAGRTFAVRSLDDLTVVAPQGGVTARRVDVLRLPVRFELAELEALIAAATEPPPTAPVPARGGAPDVR